MNEFRRAGMIAVWCLSLLFVPKLVVAPAQTPGTEPRHIPAASGGMSLGGCPLFPGDNIWNVRVDTMPLHARSGDWVTSIGRNTGFHMDFGSGTWAGGPIGIPVNLVAGSQVPKYSPTFYYPDESDPGPYPIPLNPLREYGSDHHVLIVDTESCKLYELYDAEAAGGQWYGGSGAVWDLNSHALRPEGWTSADAAGLPILPGLVRYDEVAAGQINHAIRFTASITQRAYVWPARHFASSNTSATRPPMGARFRLKASFDIAGFDPLLQVILRAMKNYGIILADNGSNWYVSGVPDERWDNGLLHELDVLTGADFEAVDASGLMFDQDSGRAQVWWSGEVDLGGGWKWTSWLGFYNTDSLPWIYHRQHGFLYPYEHGSGGVTFWDDSMGKFWWTDTAVYPGVYRFGAGANWLWYQTGSSAPRWFYNWGTGLWESMP